jgi:hypothetical protein
MAADVFVEGGVDGILFGLEFAELDRFGDEFVVERKIGGDGAPPLCKSLHNEGADRQGGNAALRRG